MYTVSELAKMFNTTRQTIYNKLESEDLQPFINKTDKGLRLQIEGMNALQLIMSESKIAPKTEIDNNFTTLTPSIDVTKTPQNNPYLDKYIETLHQNINDLKQENERLRAELQSKDKMLFDTLTRQQLLLEDKQGKEKRGFWNVFKK